jgi:Icc-related predicted phosphoesterase
LLDAVRQKNPRFHIFGHIHGGAGTFESESTRFINAAYLNERYRPLPPAGKIHVIDI